MKKLLKTLSISLIMALIALPTMAQMGNRADRGTGIRNQTPRGDRMQMFTNIPADVRADIHIAVFDEYLNLTDTQKTKLAEIDRDFADKGIALRTEAMGRDRKNVAMRDLQNEHQVAIHDLLTKEQYATYLSKREAIRVETQQRMRDYLAKN